MVFSNVQPGLIAAVALFQQPNFHGRLRAVPGHCRERGGG